jgi:hypothetical protein
LQAEQAAGGAAGDLDGDTVTPEGVQDDARVLDGDAERRAREVVESSGRADGRRLGATG